MHVEHLRIPIGSGALHVERVGRGGPAVVLIHGLGTCAFLWRRLAPALADAGYTALAIDLLGHGESDRPEDADYSVVAQTQYLTQALAALRIPSASLVGLGVGALVALMLGANTRIRIDGVALLSPPDPDDLPGADIRALQRQSARVALSANTLFGARPVLATLLKSGVQNPINMPDLLIARYMAPFVGTDGLSHLLHLTAAIELPDNARVRFSQLGARVIVVEGKSHGDISRAPVEWATVLPLAQVEMASVAESGWLLPEDAPVELERALLRWLKPATAL